MRETKLVCDKCKKELPTHPHEDYFALSINDQLKAEMRHMELCRDCHDKTLKFD